MPIFITSDLHLGSRHADIAAFNRFLDQLPSDATLVLNGDTVNHRYGEDNLVGLHAATLKRLVAESARRRIVWILGNNDLHVSQRDMGRIEFRPDFAIGSLHVEHGHRFDHIMPRVRPCLFLAKRAYDLFEALSGSRCHIASRIKFLNGLYHVLTQHVARHAVAYAHAHGFSTMTCGHTHYPEDRVIDGVRYINTGAWTEPGNTVVAADDDGGIRVVPATGPHAQP